MKNEKINKRVISEYIVLGIILGLAALLRFVHLRTLPNWFMDEGEFTQLARYLSGGSFDFLGIRNSLLLIGRPPLFLWVVAGVFKLFGTDILILRVVTVLCSLVAIGVCFYLARQALGVKTAFYAALLLAIVPDYIYNNRIGFTYNWTSLWMLVFVFAIWKYLAQRRAGWYVFACLAAGISIASDYIGIISVLVLLYITIRQRPKQLWGLLLVGLPLILSVLPIFIVAPADAWGDITNTFIAGKENQWGLIVRLGDMIIRYGGVFINQVYIVLGIIGIFILPDKHLRNLLLLMLAGMFLLFTYSRDLSGHYLLPIWPIIVIGLGNFIEKSVSYLHSLVTTSITGYFENSTKKLALAQNYLAPIGSTLAMFVVVYLPITWVLILSISSFVGGNISAENAMKWSPYFQGFVATADAEAIAQKIIPSLANDDFVVAPGVISWMLPSNSADARTVAAYEYGGETLDMVGFDRSRFTVDSSLGNAKYAIVDNSWRAWMVNLSPDIAALLKEVNTWPLIMAQGSLQLYCNPRYCR